ncbi:MAG: hypothetical protein Q9221_003575 [Calogaya cf. arnoldii]
MSTVNPNPAFKLDSPKPESSRNPDPQQWDVSNQVPFVWMGKRPFQALDEGTVDADRKFRAPQVLANAVADKYCQPTLWLDLLTMANREDLERALDPELFVKYTRWCRLALVSIDPDHIAAYQPDPLTASNSAPSTLDPKIIKSDKTNLRDLADFTTVTTMLRQADQQFSPWVIDENNRGIFFQRKPLVDIIKYPYNQGGPLQVTPAFVEEYPAFKGMKEIISPLEIRFLDLEIYPRWMVTLPSTLDRRKPKAGKLAAPDSQYIGFHYSASVDIDGRVPVNSFFASPAGHPILKHYRQRILAGYEFLLRHNYVWVDEKPKSDPPGDFARSLLSRFLTFKLKVLRSILKVRTLKMEAPGL